MLQNRFARTGVCAFCLTMGASFGGGVSAIAADPPPKEKETAKAVLKAAVPPPGVQSVAPRGANPGRAVAFDVKGENLHGIRDVWTSFPAKLVKLEPVGDKRDRLTVRLEVAAEAPLGLHWLRLIGDGGVSPPLQVLVDDYRTEPRPKDPEPASTAAKPLPLDAGVEGAVPKGGSHFFRVAVKQGERIFVDVWAERFGSALDPLVRILNADGTEELAWADDADLTGKDAQLAWLPPQDGEVLLELRDSKNEGGSGHRYRLRVGRTPPVEAVVPTGATAGVATAFKPLSVFKRPQTPLTWSAPAGESGLRQIAFSKASGGGGGWGWIVVGSRPELLEPELRAEFGGGAKDSDPPSGDALTSPCAVTGRLSKPREQDRYRIPLAAGAKIVVRGLTRELGLPAFLRLALLDEKGREVARGVDVDGGGVRLEAAAKTAGLHTLAVDDVAHRGGPTWLYRLELEEPSPSATLGFHSAEGKGERIESLQAVAGGSARVKLGLQRKGFDGEASVKLRWSHGGDAAVGRIEAKKSDVVLEIPLPVDARPGTLLWLEAEAEYDVGGKTATARAETSPAHETNPFRLPPEPVWGRRLAVGAAAAAEGKKPPDKAPEKPSEEKK